MEKINEEMQGMIAKVRYAEGLDDALEKLNDLVGLDAVKQEMQTLVQMLKMYKARKEAGLHSVEPSKHWIFKGNPGTGKTTVARIMADIYYQLGFLEKGNFITVRYEDVVVGYTVQTAKKMQKKIDEAMGGVLYIEDPYEFVRYGNDFGKEALSRVYYALHEHYHDFALILAGCAEPMDKFINDNVWLQPRIRKTVDFPDYNGEEMLQIFQKFCDKFVYELGEDSIEILRKYFIQMCDGKQKGFGSVLTVKQRFQQMIEKQSKRVATMENATREDLITVLPQDLPIQ